MRCSLSINKKNTKKNALIAVVDRFYMRVDKLNPAVRMACFDMSSAFDIVYHSIFIQSVKIYLQYSRSWPGFDLIQPIAVFICFHLFKGFSFSEELILDCD